ncbi:ABI family, member 3 (NESH) binding protein b isoform X1 [Thunnus maccoyii]|uniref:ABI family, member 3 (NESH) binding protein b isoform X1 n=1 Tax=Thunnus maccoyii TaxID=8240 RepID=UPI001C4BB91F|nr:ABI family, member 3 (NESH) binding protein b isoform X1 [Thunnus maccoyii]
MAGIAPLLRVLLLLLGGTILLCGIPAQGIRVRRQNMKVRINATGDTIVMKFVRPSPDVKLEGYILGYGSSMFSKQFIQLPENGKPYETEMDAEPKYLVAVQPIPANDVKKHCTGKVNLEKPLHLVIGSVSPTAVLLSWGNYLKTPYEGNIMNECLEDGFYTIRYRERNRKWIYQTCPTSDTVIDNLKPNTAYEFGVRSNKDDRSGTWSKPVIHNTNMGNKNAQKPYKLRNPLAKPMKPLGPHTLFPPRPALHNRTQPRLPALFKNPGFPGAPRTSFVPPDSHQDSFPLPGSAEPKRPHVSFDKGNTFRNDSNQPADPPPALPHLLPTKAPPTNTTASPLLKLPSNGDMLQGQTQPRAPTNAPEKPHNPSAFGKSQDRSSLLRSALANERAKANNWGQSSKRNLSPSLPLQPYNPAASTVSRSMGPPSRKPLFPFSNGFRQPHSSSRSSNSSPTSGKLGVNGQPHRGISPPKPALWSRPRLVNNSLLEDKKAEFPDVFGRSGPTIEEHFYGSPARPSTPINKKPNQVGKPGDTDKVNNLKQNDKLPFLKPKVPLATTKPTKQERKQATTVSPTPATSRQETWEDSDLFKSKPTSDVDALGKKRYVAPHVIYQTGKKPDEPCSITSSLSYFPEDEPSEANVTAPPRTAPSNLTVVTVEGCPSFIILDWEKTDNDTTEYEVISTTKGPDGEQVSILTTNQTHTTVENLKPESSYEFKVKPKNELGEGPSSEPVSFNTESADPRVSENVSGKDAIWTQFPFKTDSYSDCHGKQYVKRTWYRKFVGVQLCNSLRYKIYLSDSLNGKFYNIGDQTGFGEDHCQFVDSFLDGRTGRQLQADQLPSRAGFYRALRQEPVHFGQIGGHSHVNYVSWYECGTPIPGKW